MGAVGWGLIATTFVACFVEMVEAATIVMAMGFSRSWRSAVLGTLAAVAALAVVTAIAGYALATWLPESLVQLVVGALLLSFGLQWLRKAVLRSSGRKTIHDEDAIYREELAAAEAAGEQGKRVDLFAFLVSFKGVFLEGMEVVFIVITFGLNAGDVPAAVVGAAAAILCVLALAVVVRRPLSMIDENLLKYGVGLLLATFGTFWAVEGLGVFREGHASVEWALSDATLFVLLVGWLLVSQLLIRVLRSSGPAVVERDDREQGQVIA